MITKHSNIQSRQEKIILEDQAFIEWFMKNKDFPDRAEYYTRIFLKWICHYWRLKTNKNISHMVMVAHLYEERRWININFLKTKYETLYQMPIQQTPIFNEYMQLQPLNKIEWRFIRNLVLSEVILIHETQSHIQMSDSNYFDTEEEYIAYLKNSNFL